MCQKKKKNTPDEHGKEKKIHLKLDTDLRAVHKSLNRNGLNGRVDVKKPLLTIGRETGRKSYGTLNYSRTGLRISDNWFFGVKATLAAPLHDLAKLQAGCPS